MNHCLRYLTINRMCHSIAWYPSYYVLLTDLLWQLQIMLRLPISKLVDLKSQQNKTGKQGSSLTLLPTSLLWRLKAVRASLPFSSLSMKRLATFFPNLILSPQPPHFQLLLSNWDGFSVSAHPHPGIFLLAHWRVISYVMAAELMAWRKAVSRLAGIKNTRYTRIPIHHFKKSNYTHKHTHEIGAHTTRRERDNYKT